MVNENTTKVEEYKKDIEARRFENARLEGEIQ